jgi:lysine 2,3-aminomutase
MSSGKYQNEPTDGINAKAVWRPQDLDGLPISATERARNHIAEQTFNIRIPKHYVSQIDWDNPSDPIRLQTIPQAEELLFDPRELTDPIGDHAHSPVPRITHRYPDRVLLYPTYQCAVYCRHCFRKESLSDANDQFSEELLRPAFSYIAAHPEVQEVIVTGGDPLILSSPRLAYLRSQLEAIPHLRMIRFHTRVPVVTPQRVDQGLVDALRGRLMVCVVTHFNHPQEITPECKVAAQRLREAGFVLLNQTVLLRGINDDAETLQTLCRELFYTLGIKPYYLHHCDLTRGLSHFRTTIAEGLDIMKKLRGYMSGPCVPQYVLDLPGGNGKIPLGPSYTVAQDGHSYTFRNYQGKVCAYEEVVPQNPPRKQSESQTKTESQPEK